MIDLANEGENDAEWMCRVEPGAPRPKSSPLHKKVKISFDPGMSFVRSQTPWQFADAKFLKLFTSLQKQLWVRHIYACWWSNTVTGGRFPEQCGWWGSQCAIPQWRWSGQRQTPSVVKGPCLPQWAKVTTFNFLNAMLTRCHQERWRHCLRSVESWATFFYQEDAFSPLWHPRSHSYSSTLFVWDKLLTFTRL